MPDKMFEVLVAIEVAEWLLKNMHYRANEQYAYALHSLAQRCDFFGYTKDDLKECYWLGFKQGLPPNETTIHESALMASESFKGALTNKELLEAVQTAATRGIDAVEAAKAEEGLPGGIHAILDDVSKTFLRARGLCHMSLSSGGAVDNSPVSEDPEKGLAKYLEVEVV